MAMTGTSVPHGWNYDVMRDRYYDDRGRFVQSNDILKYGSVINAIIAIHGPQAIRGATGAPSQAMQQVAVGANGPAGPFSTDDSIFAVDSRVISPPQTFEFQTRLGRITLNLETGDITFPPDIGRNEAIRDFWLGFQENFQPSNKKLYEEKIFRLEKELAETKINATLMRQENEKTANKRVAEKIAKKYGNEKFIMVKPDDLIKFVEEA